MEVDQLKDTSVYQTLHSSIENVMRHKLFYRKTCQYLLEVPSFDRDVFDLPEVDIPKVMRQVSLEEPQGRTSCLFNNTYSNDIQCAEQIWSL